ncbi:hypothetical protein AVEN_106554-1 [Araneus ventricosus]|uniref:Uncharacterized protein n=1 Tax=Araneus ventricosus TaxID=182803 RepID=A0A4Y2RJX5_ARAVE|nr:hypothetical protein AVEN_106554-1 [Araneus ventricosus]
MSRFKARQGLIWDGPRNFEPRATPELAPPSPSFHATPTGGRLATAYDVACSGPALESGFGPGDLPARGPRLYHLAAAAPLIVGGNKNKRQESNTALVSQKHTECVNVAHIMSLSCPLIVERKTSAKVRLSSNQNVAYIFLPVKPWIVIGWRIPRVFDQCYLILGFADSRFNPGSVKFGEYTA